MNRRGFLGLLSGLFAAGAAASKAQPIVGVDPANPDIVTAGTDGQSTFTIECLPGFEPKLPALPPKEVLDEVNREVQAFGLQRIGITCPKCGAVGGPKCPCGWEYSSLFKTSDIRYTNGLAGEERDIIIRNTPVGLGAPLGALPEIDYVFPANLGECKRDPANCSGRPLYEKRIAFVLPVKPPPDCYPAGMDEA